MDDGLKQRVAPGRPTLPAGAGSFAIEGSPADFADELLIDGYAGALEAASRRNALQPEMRRRFGDLPSKHRLHGDAFTLEVRHRTCAKARDEDVLLALLAARDRVTAAFRFHPHAMAKSLRRDPGLRSWLADEAWLVHFPVFRRIKAR